MAPDAKRRKPQVAVVAPVAPEPVAAPKVEATGTPYLLDFFPLEGEKQTRLSPFFRALRDGRLTTTRCKKDGAVLWPPRLACPRCHTTDLEWIDLPRRGHVYAFSAVLAGAPLGMEADVPFVVGLVDLDGIPLRLFGRINGKAWTECRVGMPVEVETYDVPGDRVFYRFRSVE